MNILSALKKKHEEEKERKEETRSILQELKGKKQFNMNVSKDTIDKVKRLAEVLGNPPSPRSRRSKTQAC